MELLTGYGPVDPRLFPYTVAVHLPYATDWYGPVSGKGPVPDGLDDEGARFACFGRGRGDMVENIRVAIRHAEKADPAYGIFHAASACWGELFRTEFSYTDAEVLTLLADILNEAVSVFPGGEPPFRLVLENTWWPGLRLRDGEGYRLLERKLEFDDWGICLDTGHLLASSRASRDQETAVEVLHAYADRYPASMLDRMTNMHLHVNTSADYLAGMTEPDVAGLPYAEVMDRAYRHVGRMDQHAPFTDPAVTGFVDRISPDFIVHEMGADDIEEHFRDHAVQRALFR